MIDGIGYERVASPIKVFKSFGGLNPWYIRYR